MPVSKHDVVLIAPWLLHRHEKLWRDPTAFIPVALHAGERRRPIALPICRSASARGSVSARISRWWKPPLALAKIVGAFRVELIDREPVMPIGVVTTQPERSPMFRITPR